MKLAVPSQVSATQVPTTFALPQGEDRIVSDNHAFWGTHSSPGAAGVFSHAQIFNPAASGKVIYVDKLIVYGPVGVGDLHVKLHNVALANLSSEQPGSKLVGGAAPSAQFRDQTNVAVFGTAGVAVRTAAATDRELVFNPPLRLPAGTGAHAVRTIVNEFLRANWQFREY